MEKKLDPKKKVEVTPFHIDKTGWVVDRCSNKAAEDAPSAFVEFSITAKSKTTEKEKMTPSI